MADMVGFGWIAQSTHLTVVVGEWVSGVAGEAGRFGHAELVMRWVSVSGN